MFSPVVCSTKGRKCPFLFISRTNWSFASRIFIRSFVSLPVRPSYRPRRPCIANELKSCAILVRYALFCSMVVRPTPRFCRSDAARTRLVWMVLRKVGKFCSMRVHKRLARYFLRAWVPRRSSGRPLQGGLLKKSCSFWNRSKGPTP